MAEITREHLELAALAYGIDESWIGNAAYMDGMLSTWRPHLDDGDAARLAVRLNISMAHSICPPRWIADHHSLDAVHSCPHDGTDPDKMRAWREAVVLCAAAVGAKMKGGER